MEPRIVAQAVCSSCKLAFHIRDVLLVQGPRIPLTLCCGHASCEPCLKTAYNEKRTKLTCGVCQQVSPIIGTLKDIRSEFPVHLYVLGQHVTSAHTKKHKDSQLYFQPVKRPASNEIVSKVLCTECEKGKAVCVCKQCDAPFCDSCFDTVHKGAKSLKTHKRIDINLYRKPVEPVLCPKHPKNPMELYCTECNVVICLFCSVTDHSGHHIISATDQNESLLPDLKKSLDRGVAIRQRLLQSQKEALELEAVRCSPDEEEVEQGLMWAMSRLHGLLQLREARLLARLSQRRQDLSARIGDLSAELSASIASLDDAMKLSRDAVLARPNVPLLAVKQKLDDACAAPCHLVTRSPAAGPCRLIAEQDVVGPLERLVDVVVPEPLELLLVAEVDLPPSHIPSSIEVTPDRTFEALDFELPVAVASDVDSSSRSDIAASTTSSPLSASHQNLSDLSGSLSGAASVSAPIPKRKCSQKSSQKSSKQPDVEYKIPKGLGEGDQEDVTISHFVDPLNFYVQFISNVPYLGEMIVEYNRCAAQSPPVNDVQRDALYLVQYSADGNWYRGRIRAFVKDSSNTETLYEVFFYDYGNIETVSIDKIRKILPRHATAPAEAIKCSLFDLAPPPGGWKSSARSTMVEIVNDSPMRMYVICVEKDHLLVDLCPINSDFESEMRTSVRDTLLFMGEGFFIEQKTPSWYNSSIFPTKSFTFDSNITVNCNYDVLISHVDSPSDFYVQLMRNTDDLNTMMSKLMEYYSSLPPKKSLVYSPVKGMACVAKYSVDDNWYRVIVVDIPESKKVQVQYIDYGNKEVLLWTELRVLTNRFLKLPAQAIHCSLADISAFSENGWLPESSKLLLDLCNDEELLKINVDSVKDTTHSVLLYRCGEDKDTCINALLCQLKLARSTGCNSSAIVEYYKDNTDFVKAQEEHEDCNSGVVFSENRESNVPSRGRADNHDRRGSRRSKSSVQARLEAFRNPIKIIESGSNLLEAKKNSEDQNGVPEAVSSPEKVKVKDKLPLKRAIKVLEAESPGCLYVMMNEHEKSIESLLKEMYEYYEKLSNNADDWLPEVRMRCAAKSNADHRWHRGIVLEALQDKKFKVMLKDVGRQEVIDKSRLRPLTKKEFLSVRDGTIKCHLANVQPAGASVAGRKPVWSTLACEKLRKVVSQYHDIFITKRGQVDLDERSIPVDLWICNAVTSPLGPCQDEWFTVNRVLVEQGVALPVRPNPMDEEDMPMTNDDFSLLSRYPDSNVMEWLIKTKQDEDTSSVNSIELSDFEGDESLSPNKTQDWLPPIPFDAEEFLGFATYVDFECHIYIHEFGKSSQTLHHIQTRLNSKFKNSKPKPHDSFWFPGQICVVQYHNDSNWYRGRVLKVLDNHTIDVLFVDYGNVENCTASELRKNVFLKNTPVQAHKCRLQGLEPISADGKWPIPVLDFLHATLVEKDCKVKILEWPSVDDECYVVELKTTGGIPLKDVLTEMCYATYTPSYKQCVTVPEETCEIHDNNSDVISEIHDNNSDVIILEEMDTLENSCQRNSDSQSTVSSFCNSIKTPPTELLLNDTCMSDSDNGIATPKVEFESSSHDQECSQCAGRHRSEAPCVKECRSSPSKKITLKVDDECPTNQLVFRKRVPKLEASPYKNCDQEEECNLSTLPCSLEKGSEEKCSMFSSSSDLSEQSLESKIPLTTKLKSPVNRTKFDMLDFLHTVRSLYLEPQKYKPFSPPQSNTWIVAPMSVLAPTTVVLQIVGIPSEPDWKGRLEFLNLMEEMQKMAPEYPNIREPLPEMACCVSSSNTWYRGKVAEINNDQVEVELVDGGDFVTVSVTELKCIPKELLEVPVQALVCHLGNVSVMPDVNADHVGQELCKCLFLHEWTCKVMCREPLTVQLYNVDESGEESLVYQNLIDQRLFGYISHVP